ncbi:MAG: two-component system chemotaxis response regulator CheB [Gammaproteobacteria bacterium]|jgi:two-component system chemotaxis response regulator CheB
MTRLTKGMLGNPVRVIVVDHSTLFRRLVSELLETDGTIEVIGTASDPYSARKKINELDPDVITLDVEMDGMDGITFLGHLMRLRPMPVVMVSSLTEHGAEVTLEALSLGAIDVVTKPKLDVIVAFKEQGPELRSKVIAACHTTPKRLLPNTARLATQSNGRLRLRSPGQLITIGASTGGTQAVREVLAQMPSDSPCILITQHIPESFSRSFAMRLNENSAMTVQQASDGDPLVAGHAYVAPGDQHLEIVRSGTGFACRLTRNSPVNHHRPSVDVLFASAAKLVGRNATGVLLTGMGADGAKGLLAMREAGAHTLCQDQSSSVVWGMPGAAVMLRAACEVLPLDQIADGILSNVKRPTGKVGKQNAA